MEKNHSRQITTQPLFRFDRLRTFLPALILCTLPVVFFYKLFFSAQLPFPGDLLVSEYKPWSTYAYLGYNPGSYPSKKQYFDTIRQIYPWRTLVNTQWKSGSLPLWNPHNFSGTPLLANIQSQVIYPLTVLYAFFRQPIAWSILIVLQPFLASLFMYAYLRIINRSSLASLLGAIAYGYCLFMTVFLEYNTIGHVILWLPLLLFSIEKIQGLPDTQLPRFIFVLALAITFFAGHLQLAGVILIFSGIYIGISGMAIEEILVRRKFFLDMSILLLLGIGIACVQLIPTAELLSLSARSSHDYNDLMNRLLVQPKEFFMMLMPDLFGNPATGNYLLNDSYPGKALSVGIVPLFFALFGIWRTKKNWLFSFFLCSTVVLFILVSNNPLSAFLYTLPIPFLGSSSPSNMLFLTSFGLSVLAAFGIDTFLEQKNTIPKTPLVSVCLLFLLIWVLGLTGHLIMIRSMLLLGTLIFGICIFLFVLASVLPRKKQAITVLFLVLAVGELWYYFQKFNPFVPESLVFPPAPVTQWLEKKNVPSRFWGYGTAVVEANFATQLSLFSPDGYDPLYPKNYGALIGASEKGIVTEEFTSLNRSDAVITGGYGETDFIRNDARKKLLNLLGVRYIFNRTENGTTAQTFPPDTFPVVYQSDGWLVHDNKNTLPRAFLVTLSQATPTAQSFQQQFFSSSFNPREYALTERPLATPLEHAIAGTATINDYSPNRIRISTEEETTQLLVLTDTYFPGWNAYVDGKQMPIYKTFFTFRGVEVPPGKHQVLFLYQPESIMEGILITATSIVLLLFISAWKKIRVHTHSGKQK